MSRELSIESIVRALQSVRVPAVSTEHELHLLIAAALQDGGFAVCREVTLAPRCRIDFVVGRVGLEVKKARPERARLIRQASRYLASNQLDALILVVERNIDLPSTILGKPVVVLGLNKLWGVALP